MTEILAKSDLERLTGKKRFRAQARALAQMGVRFILRPDGFPVVVRQAIVAEMENKPVRLNLDT